MVLRAGPTSDSGKRRARTPTLPTFHKLRVGRRPMNDGSITRSIGQVGLMMYSIVFVLVLKQDLGNHK